MDWCFAIVNNRLAELFFDKKKNKIKIIGHCYVKASEYKTKTEQKWVEKDTGNIRLSFYENSYTAKNPKLWWDRVNSPQIYYP